MNLSRLPRLGVSILDQVFDSLKVVVEHYQWIGSATNGGPSFDIMVTRRAVVDYTQRLRRTASGEDVLQKATIYFIGPMPPHGAEGRREPIDPRDKWILPNRYTGPILEVIGIADPQTGNPYSYEVILG